MDNDAVGAIRRAIMDADPEETPSASTEPRSFGEEAKPQPTTDAGLPFTQDNSRDWLSVQQAVGNREEARANVRGRSSRNASPDAQVMAGREFVQRGGADGAGRD
jgi:hypothetical protein